MAGLLVITLQGGGAWERALRPPPMRWLGQYSYGLYLLQFPVQLFLRTHGVSRETVGRVPFALIAVSMTAMLAYLSWHLWEKQWLALKDRVPLRVVHQSSTVLPL